VLPGKNPIFYLHKTLHKTLELLLYKLTKIPNQMGEHSQ